MRYLIVFADHSEAVIDAEEAQIGTFAVVFTDGDSITIVPFANVLTMSYGATHQGAGHDHS